MKARMSALLSLVALVVLPLLLFSSKPALGQSKSGESGLTEAPAGFELQSNGFVTQDVFLSDAAVFNLVHTVSDGLGPTFNSNSCRSCHMTPISGGSSQMFEMRAGHDDTDGNFVNPTVKIDDGRATIGPRSLFNLNSICPADDPTQIINGEPFDIQDHSVAEPIPQSENVRSKRETLSALGDGFLESVPDDEIIALSQKECSKSGSGRGEGICGEYIMVPVLEAPGQALAVDHFGWKGQHASLLSFTSDASVGEMGITNRFQPNNVDATTVCKLTTDPEDVIQSDGLENIDLDTEFMRSTLAPPRDPVTKGSATVQLGAAIFHQIGCSICHTPTLTTGAPGTTVDAGAFTIPDALGNKIIHPFSDLLLHDVGTGDGILQNGPSDTQNKLRTPPLWGLRVRTRLMHDGESTSINNAVLRHAGEATNVINQFKALSQADKHDLLAFLNSL